MVTPNPLLDVPPGLGQVANTVRYLVVDRDLQPKGRVQPLEAGSVTANTAGSIKRQLQGFVLGESDMRDINPFTDRILPFWVLEDGTEWPLGVFMFTNSAEHSGTYASATDIALMDQEFVLQQGIKFPVSIPPGGQIVPAVLQLVGEVGITNRSVPVTSGATVADPRSWPAGTSRIEILKQLCLSAGWLPPYFDNTGMFIIRVPPNLLTDSPDHVYTGARVRYSTPVVQANRLSAPNTFVVIGTGPSKGDISAFSYVDPTLDFSVSNRDGLEVVSVTRMQGIENTEQAQTMADTLAASAVGYQQISFEGPADPRHDLFQTVEWSDGTIYRELSWTLKLETPGGFHSHVLTLGGFPSGS